MAQAPEPPLGDTRLTVHTLVREDIFAGFLQNDLVRLARAERNLESLLASRPQSRAHVLGWQGSAVLTRAALAAEANQPDRFQPLYARARALFAEANQLAPADVGVSAIIGGTQVAVADRLPAAERAASWELGYASYQQLWTMQGQLLDKLPLHMAGEVLSGLAQSALRTGRTAEVDGHLDRILALLPGSAYAERAQEWKNDPSARANVKLTCQSCHAPGTLVARVAAVSKEAPAR